MKLMLVGVALALPSTAGAGVVNGSFETGDYSGWTLKKVAPAQTFATSAVASSGATIAYSGWAHDFADGIDVQQYSSGLPLAMAASDGDHAAVQLQNGPATVRMYQTVHVPAHGAALAWDMSYRNTWTAFEADQRVRVMLRDPATDDVLATVFETLPGDAMTTPLSHYAVDLAAYAGQDVRLDVTLDVQKHFLDVVLDNFALTGRDDLSDPGLGAGDVALAGDRAPGAPVDEGGDDGAAADGGCSAGGGGGFALALAIASSLARRSSRSRRSSTR